jgi:hydrogenase maturation protease
MSDLDVLFARGDVVKIVVVGIGNDFRGDDSAGLVAARLLKSRSLPNTEIVELNGEVTRLVDILPLFDAAILIDATCSTSPAGTIHRIDLSSDPLPPDGNQRSTHGISLASVIELARNGDAFPCTLLLYGIEGASFDHSPDMTPEVSIAVNRIPDLVARDIAAIQ